MSPKGRVELRSLFDTPAKEKQVGRMEQSAAKVAEWKEVARYLGKSIRTLQRWERDLIPSTRRTYGKSRSGSFAVSAELDSWAQAHVRAEQAELEENVFIVELMLSNSATLLGDRPSLF
jgi:hypothetical protein